MEAGGTPSAALPRQAVTGCPSFVSVAPITYADSAIAPPQPIPLWWVQLPPVAGAVKVLMPPVPGANSRSVLSGMTTSARPLFPFQPVATVDVPTAFPAGDSRVSEIDVDELPRFQITCSTPSAVRASPSWLPAWVGPLIRDHGEAAGAARTAPATSATAPSEAARAMLVKR